MRVVILRWEALAVRNDGDDYAAIHRVEHNPRLRGKRSRFNCINIMAHLLENVETELVELGAARRSGLLEPDVETEWAVVVVARYWLQLKKSVSKRLHC